MLTDNVNGQKSGEGNYKDGRPDGEGTGFFPNGSKALVHHWVNGISEGEETGYYPSGKISYRGQYHGDAQVGTWIWYNEDGSVQLKKDFPKP